MALCVLRTAPVHWPVVRTPAGGSQTYTTYPTVIKMISNLDILITITIIFTFNHFSWLNALRSFGSRNIGVVFKNAIWPPKPDVFYECLKTAYVVKLDHSKKKTKIFCTFETNNSEESNASYRYGSITWLNVFLTRKRSCFLLCFVFFNSVIFTYWMH